MITFILILILAIAIISVVVNNKSRYGSDKAEFVFIASVFCLVVFLTLFITLLISISNGQTIDSRIELYQSQNTEIESKIQATVANYLAHEKQTYKDLKPDNAITVALAYPELHSNELIKKQIEVYEDNNKKILGLKEEKLAQSVYKWWLYFGR